MTAEKVPLVLVADDESDLLGIVTFRLQRAGYDIVTASDGAEALALTRERRPELCLLDMMMPKLSGMEVLREIRADPELAGTRVIMLTARALEGDVQRSFEAGVDDYLTKPFSPQELIARVTAQLGRSRA
jgi:DNA-binding response OmpR family regulator